MEKTIVRGYVKWTDEDGVFHKEPLADHPDMLARATPEQQIRAEEARRLNAAAEEQLKEDDFNREKEAKATLKALKEAPDEVLTADQVEETKEEEKPNNDELEKFTPKDENKE